MATTTQVSYPPPPLLSSLAFDDLPVSNQLTHVREIGDPANSSDVPGTVTPNPSSSVPMDRHQPPILICNSLPPVPPRLVKRVEDGLFVEMFELLPERLNSADFNAGDLAPGIKNKPPEVSNIIDWIQCFGLYIAIISRTQPTRIADMIGYQSLIIRASQDCQEGCWVIYDRRFRLKASASPVKEWSAIDVTIWNLAFPERASRNRQRDGPQSGTPSFTNYRPLRSRQPLPKSQPICLDWNDNPNGCTRTFCRYEHKCYRCVHNPTIPDKHHKARQCPHIYKQATT